MSRAMTILFDLDGTLIDSTEAILEGFHHSFDVYTHPHPSDDEIKAQIGHPLDAMYREFKVPEEMVWDFVATYKAYYATVFKEKTLLLEGAREAIDEARKIARLGVVTTKTGKFSRELLEHFGVMDAFEVLIGREDVQRPKPDAQPIQKAIEMMHAQDDICWMIGDTRLDIESAMNAKINSVAVTSGYETMEQLKTMASVIQDDALAAVRYIANV